MKNRCQMSDVSGQTDVRKLSGLVTSIVIKQQPCSLLIFLTLFFILYSLFTVSCDLFQPNNPNYYQELRGEVAWANAKKLDVVFNAPEGWINSSSPTISQAVISRNIIDIRKGFPFTVECVPSLAYGFEDWLVFQTDFYHSLTPEDLKQSADQMRNHSLIGSTVVLVEKAKQV